MLELLSDAIEVERILEAELNGKFNLGLNIKSLMVDNRRIQDGRKIVKRRFAPILKHVKSEGGFYFYDLHDVQGFMDAMIDYHDRPAQLPAYLRITNMTGAEFIDEFSDDRMAIEREGGAILYTGTMHGYPTAVVLDGLKTYLLKTKQADIEVEITEVVMTDED